MSRSFFVMGDWECFTNDNPLTLKQDLDEQKGHTFIGVVRHPSHGLGFKFKNPQGQEWTGFYNEDSLYLEIMAVKLMKEKEGK